MRCFSQCKVTKKSENQEVFAKKYCENIKNTTFERPHRLLNKLTFQGPCFAVLCQRTAARPFFFAILSVFLKSLINNDITFMSRSCAYKSIEMMKNSLENFSSSRLFHLIKPPFCVTKISIFTQSSHCFVDFMLLFSCFHLTFFSKSLCRTLQIETFRGHVFVSVFHDTKTQTIRLIGIVFYMNVHE